MSVLSMRALRSRFGVLVRLNFAHLVHCGLLGFERLVNCGLLGCVRLEICGLIVGWFGCQSEMWRGWCMNLVAVLGGLNRNRMG